MTPMKKILAITLALAFVLLCACNGNTADTTETESSTEAETLPPEATTADSLGTDEVDSATVMTIYFTHTDPIGLAAEYINEKTEGSSYKIETLKDYPEDENELADVISQELAKDARPVIENMPPELLDYDIIFLCFPAWGGSVPRAVIAFIESYDMRDKIIIPVVYGTEDDMSNALIEINKLFPGAMLINGYSFTGDLAASQPALDTWLDTVLYG